MDVDEMMRRASKDLEEAEAQLAAAEGRVAELKTIRDGLRFALQRYGQTQAAEAVKPKAEEPTLRPARAGKPLDGTIGDMVLAVLGDAGRPLATVEVREMINASGRRLNREQVRSALHYLVRKDRISRVGPGLWTLPGERRPTTDFGPADSAAGPNGSGENSTPDKLTFSPERA
jgi:hypothetical protein